MKYALRPTFAVAVALTIGLTSCSKKAEVTSQDSGIATSPQRIAETQGWQIENVEARERVWSALDSHREPAEADWQRLVRAADTETNAFDLSLAMMFSRHMTDKYRAPVLKWCERNMEQTNDESAAVVAYDCYVRSAGPDRDLWARRLKARGGDYAEKIAEADSRAAARK
jgi:hypothetical protein